MQPLKQSSCLTGSTGKMKVDKIEYDQNGYGLDILRAEVNYRPAWGERSAVFREKARCLLDVSYGHGSRGTLDCFLADNGLHAPTLIFIHGGYWHKGDKSFYSYVAEPFVARGVSCITINYDFCPNVRMTDIVQQVRVAMAWIWRNAEALGVSRKLFVSGHSAGGHLTAMMMATDWASYDSNLPSSLFLGAIPVSGLHDLRPLVDIPLNDVLLMDAEETATISPVNLPLRSNAPQLVVCGQAESDAFNAQSDLYVSTFESPDRRLERYAVPGANHFDVMNAFADPEHPFFQKMLALITARG